VPILVVCEACGKKLKAPDSYAGRKAKCSQCGNIIHIGTPAEAEPQPKLPEREERAQRLPTRPKAPEPEEADADEPGDEVDRPKKKKKKKKKKRRSQPDQSVPEWLVWTGGLFATIAVMGIAAGILVLTGHAWIPIFLAIRLAIMLPISIVILIISMFISSAIVGGIDFGEVHVVIPKALILLLITNPIYAIPCIGGFLALPIWFIGLMLVFRMEIWETRVLVIVNWVLNWVAFIFVLSVIINLIGLAKLPRDVKVQLPHRAATQQEAIDLKAIKSLGGSYEPEDEENPDSPIVEISLSGTRATDADLTPVTHFFNLKVLKLEKTQITDGGLAKLKGLAELRILDLSHTKITDAGLEHLKDMKQLGSLLLVGTSVTNEGFMKLRQALPNTEILLREDDQ